MPATQRLSPAPTACRQTTNAAPFARIYNGDGAGSARIDIGAFERQVQPLPPAFFGDYNGNGIVDAADFAVLRKTFGTGGLDAYAGADGSGDGNVGPEDYEVWRAHFGETLPLPGAGNGVERASAAPVAVLGESTGVVTSLSLYAGAPIQNAETQRTSSEGQAASQRKNPPFVLAPASSHLSPHRQAVRESLGAQRTFAASRADEALVAWLASQPDTRKQFYDDDTAETWASEVVNGTDDVHVDTVEQVFAQLASN